MQTMSSNTRQTTITIKDLTKLSFNKYKNQHWATQKRFKDTLRVLVGSATKFA